MNPGFVVGVEMLPMPRAALLCEAQLEGRQCPWCAGCPERALGVRLSVLGGGLLRWKPRACRDCTRTQAARVHRLHIRACARCAPRMQCEDARALYALSVEAPASGRGESEAG